MSGAYHDHVILGTGCHPVLFYCLRILVIGSGGREHALCWKLAQNKSCTIYATPGNPGMATCATCLPSANSFRPGLTIVGPETPLADGIVDRCRERGWPIIGPTAAAARIETSKAFAKAVMQQAGIATARYILVQSEQDAVAALQRFPFPVVLKADGLAAGKGVVIAHTRDEARRAIAELLAQSGRLIIEEFLIGEEVSFIVLTDGVHVTPFEPAQDHKAVFDEDEGPNTGGMGAYSDGRILSAVEQQAVIDSVIHPALDYMRRQGCPFTGFLYAGLMMTADGPKVLEFNCRLGDPETQVLMHRLESDLVGTLLAPGSAQLTWKTDPSVCVVLAAKGYPEIVRTGDPISGIEQVRNGVVFQAGTKMNSDALLTSGGRVLGVTASGPSLKEAIANTYAEVRKIHFDGMHYRTDIGRKGLKRW
ncbi:MAG: phosphoribosylamine--glycine ligase [Bryobacteraceae bacterium]